jgi:hypothetical protein
MQISGGQSYAWQHIVFRIILPRHETSYEDVPVIMAC